MSVRVTRTRCYSQPQYPIKTVSAKCNHKQDKIRTMSSMTALLLGSTGETGKELLKHLCDCSHYTKVILVGRRKVEDGPSTVDKVEQRVVDFDNLVCNAVMVKFLIECRPLEP